MPYMGKDDGMEVGSGLSHQAVVWEEEGHTFTFRFGRFMVSGCGGASMIDRYAAKSLRSQS